METEAVDVMPAKPNFRALEANEMSDGVVQFRRVRVPAHRLKPLHAVWKDDIYPLVYNQMNVDIRMNTKSRQVELKAKPGSDAPEEICGHLQKCADFIQAFLLGFEWEDAKSLLQLDDVYVDSFEINDVKTLRGEHKSRAIGRLSGRHGKTKFAIENATRTRIVIADTKIHIMGTFNCIKVARNSLCSLILGSPAAKVYSKLRQTASKIDL